MSVFAASDSASFAPVLPGLAEMDHRENLIWYRKVNGLYGADASEKMANADVMGCK